jgi:hypothetical protein
MQFLCSTVMGSHAKLGETTASEQTIHTSSMPLPTVQDVSLLVTCLDDCAAAHLLNHDSVAPCENGYQGLTYLIDLSLDMIIDVPAPV